MTRIHVHDVAIAEDPLLGNALRLMPYPSVTVYETGGTTPIGQALYAGATGATTLTNPFDGNSDGSYDFWLDVGQDVKVKLDGTASGLGVVTTDYTSPLGSARYGTGTFSATNAYKDGSVVDIPLTLTSLSAIVGSLGTPTTNLAAALVVQKITSAPAGGVNAAAYIALKKTTAVNATTGTALLVEVEDTGGSGVGGTGGFVEAVKGRASLMGSSRTGQANAVLGEARIETGATGGGYGGEFVLYNGNADRTVTVDPGFPFIASELLGGGGTYPNQGGTWDAYTLVNPFGDAVANFGTLIPKGAGHFGSASGYPIKQAIVGLGASLPYYLQIGDATRTPALTAIIEAQNSTISGAAMQLPYQVSAAKSRKSSLTTLYNLIRMNNDLVELGDAVTGVQVVGSLLVAGNEIVSGTLASAGLTATTVHATGLATLDAGASVTGSVSATTGVNVGTASGAATGSVRTSAGHLILPAATSGAYTSDAAYRGIKGVYSGSITASNSLVIDSYGTDVHVLLWDGTSGIATHVSLRGGGNAVDLQGLSNATWNVNADAGTTWAVFHNGTNYVLKNRSGGTRPFWALVLG